MVGDPESRCPLGSHMGSWWLALVVVGVVGSLALVEGWLACTNLKNEHCNFLIHASKPSQSSQNPTLGVVGVVGWLALVEVVVAGK